MRFENSFHICWMPNKSEPGEEIVDFAIFSVSSRAINFKLRNGT